MNLAARFLKRISSTIKKRHLSSSTLQLSEKNIVKSIRVALIGSTNAGKSTLLNNIIGLPICAVSMKAHTTLDIHNILLVRDDTEVIFVDTPGIVGAAEIKRFKFKKPFDTYKAEVLKTVNLIGVVVDASCSYGGGGLSNPIRKFLELLPKSVEIILILNKIDKIRKKSKLLNIVDGIQKEMVSNSFSKVFMISALKNDGVKDVMDYIYEVAPKKEENECLDQASVVLPAIDNDTKFKAISDCSEEKLVVDRVRASLLDNAKHEVPYNARVILEHMEEIEPNILHIFVLIECAKKNHEKMILGHLNEVIFKIRDQCEFDLEVIFGKKVILKLGTVVKQKREK